MTTYTPECWVILEIKSPKETMQKVFAGWYGGYTQGDSWKMNSGIVKVVERKNYYDFHGHSGSIYRCYKEVQRMSTYMESILAYFKSELPEGYSIEVITYGD